MAPSATPVNGAFFTKDVRSRSNGWRNWDASIPLKDLGFETDTDSAEKVTAVLMVYINDAMNKTHGDFMLSVFQPILLCCGEMFWCIYVNGEYGADVDSYNNDN
mmetsp:Transcript_38159/g.82205  ORF Transcript_38159/g.82205 Transcript_38159/m.82205 type:complete len:104 (+) Transcript_38159:781-1092(+)